MNLNYRRTAMLNDLLNAETPIFAQELMETYHISRRTLYYDMAELNDWLEQHHVTPVKGSLSKGIILDYDMRPDVKQALEEDAQQAYSFSKKERRLFLGLLLLLRHDALHIDELRHDLNVSRTSLFADLKELKQHFLTFNLSIKYHRTYGYSIVGTKENKQSAVVYYLTELFSQQGWHHLSKQLQLILDAMYFLPQSPHDGSSLHQSDIMTRSYPNHSQTTTRANFLPQIIDTNITSTVHDFIEYYQTRFSVQFREGIEKILLYSLINHAYLVKTHAHYSINEIEKVVLWLTEECRVAHNFALYIKDYSHIVLYDDEVYYLTRQLLKSADESIQNEQQFHIEMQRLKQAIHHMVSEFQTVGQLLFKNPKELETMMFGHMQVAYYRIKYRVLTDNPLTEHVKQKYSDVFYITKKVIHHVEHLLNRHVSDQEIAYLAMYFGGSIRREGLHIAKRYRGLVVTSDKTRKLAEQLRVQLEQAIPTLDVIEMVLLENHLPQLDHFQQVDLIVSTEALSCQNCHFIQVQPILTYADKEQIFSKLNAIKKNN